MKFVYGKRSVEQLETCHEDLKKILYMAISVCDVDFGVSEGNRSIERQYKLYIEGKSQIDGKLKKGKHNSKPSEAADIYIYTRDLETRRKIAYDRVHLAYVAGVITTCAKILCERGEIKHLIRWGGNWNGNGILLIDQSFDDMPHFEIIKV